MERLSTFGARASDGVVAEVHAAEVQTVARASGAVTARLVEVGPRKQENLSRRSGERQHTAWIEGADLARVEMRLSVRRVLPTDPQRCAVLRPGVVIEQLRVVRHRASEALGIEDEGLLLRDVVQR